MIARDVRVDGLIESVAELERSGEDPVPLAWLVGQAARVGRISSNQHIDYRNPRRRSSSGASPQTFVNPFSTQFTPTYIEPAKYNSTASSAGPLKCALKSKETAAPASE